MSAPFSVEVDGDTHLDSRSQCRYYEVRLRVSGSDGETTTVATVRVQRFTGSGEIRAEVISWSSRLSNVIHYVTTKSDWGDMGPGHFVIEVGEPPMYQAAREAALRESKREPW